MGWNMTRLIDADAMLERIKKDPLFPLVEEYGISGVIEAQPTVEAIPISWIEQHIENAGFVAVLNSHSVEFMLRQWYREQAERKEE